MKKLLSAALLIAACQANAQTEKGNWVITGASKLDFNSGKTVSKSNGISVEGQKSTTLSFAPSAGYFVVKNLAVGLEFEYNITTSHEDLPGPGGIENKKIKNVLLSALPSLTYYFSTDSKAFPYVGAGAGYALGRSKIQGDNIKNDTNFFHWKVKGGIAYMVSEKVAVDLGLNYDQLSTTYNFSTGSNKLYFKNFGAQIGISIFL